MLWDLQCSLFHATWRTKFCLSQFPLYLTSEGKSWRPVFVIWDDVKVAGFFWIVVLAHPLRYHFIRFFSTTILQADKDIFISIIFTHGPTGHCRQKFSSIHSCHTTIPCTCNAFRGHLIPSLTVFFSFRFKSADLLCLLSVFSENN